MSEDDVIGIVLIGGAVAFVGGIIWFVFWLEKKRTEAVHAWAHANGYSVDADTAGFQAAMAPYKLFNQGHGRRLKNLIRSTRGDLQIAICDYQYTTGSGKHQHTHNQTLCVLQSGKSRLPHFFARRQVAVFDFLGKVFGGQDINFDEDPAFSKAYVLQSSVSEAECRQLFNERVRGVFTGLSGKNIQVEGRDGTLLFHYCRRLKVEQVPELVEDALQVRGALG